MLTISDITWPAPFEPSADRDERALGLRGCVSCRRITPGHLDHRCRGPFAGRAMWWHIGHRDEWTCRLCGRPVDSRIPRTNPLGPSLDHIIPRSDGGDRDPDNLQLTHALCNWLRSNRALEVLDPDRFGRQVEQALARRAHRKRLAYRARRSARRLAGRPAANVAA